ncbi:MULTISPECIES: hypothetical protein [Catenuloplanes]|uniref:Uncharacterized protein n=1 Tax=Catenuloplanes niger TaxID=587534 RepID=A0AAE3ZNA4_9ACTN|nr:hypothetical protein [Catenuloplanes niger]MDR7322927.1 hypothetical protein [Catenuloplanes niger]
MTGRDPVRRRLRSLALLELVNIPLWAWVTFGVLDVAGTVPNLVGFALFALLLVQGAAYWLAKLRQTGRTVPGLRFFRAARLVNPALLVAGLLVTAGTRAWPGLFFAVFAVLEHVNYFHVQLMHDTRADLRRLTRHGLRRSHLARDLAG